MEGNQINLIQTRLKASELRRLVTALYKEKEDAPALRKILKDIAQGDLVVGQFLEACLDWDARMAHKEDGMWYKSEDSWRDQAGFGESQMRRCIAALEELSLLVKVVKPKGNGRPAPTAHFAVNWGVFWAQLSQLTKKTLGELADLVFPIVTESRSQLSRVVTIDRHESKESSVTETRSQLSQVVGINSVERKETPTVFHLLESTEETTGFQPPHGADGAGIDKKFQTAWNMALNQLEAQLDRANFDTWLRGVKLLRVECGAPAAADGRRASLKPLYGERSEVLIFYLSVRDDLARDALTYQFDRIVRRILVDVMGEPVDFRAEVTTGSVTVTHKVMRMPTFHSAAGG